MNRRSFLKLAAQLPLVGALARISGHVRDIPPVAPQPPVRTGYLTISQVDATTSSLNGLTFTGISADLITPGGLVGVNSRGEFILSNDSPVGIALSNAEPGEVLEVKI